MGEDPVQAVIVLSLNDPALVRAPDKNVLSQVEAFLRPILERLKKIDDRAPLSMMSTRLDPDEPQWKRPAQFDVRSQLRFAVRFARELTDLYPVARTLKLMRQWAGMYDVTPDHRPILGGVAGLDGYHHICGFSGHGFMLAPVCGRRMARQIVTGDPDGIIGSLSLDRFARGDLAVDAFKVG